MFQCTHDEYLDTPVEDIEWMLHLDATVAGAGRKPAPAAAPGVPPVPTIR